MNTMVTDAQRAMLRMAIQFNGTRELGELVMECACAYEGGLAWRIADRTAGALLRRGWIRVEGDVVYVTDEGRTAAIALEEPRC